MRILVVEQEPATRSYLARAFAAEGFHADHVGDCQVALDHAMTHHCDLAVIDIGLSSERLGVLSRFQAELPDLPVIVLSGSDDLHTKLRSFELGAVDYMSRPFSIEELLARARVHLHRHPGADAPLQAGGLTLDQLSREARIGDHVVNLTDREFRVLRLLLIHAGNVISRQRLLSAVWGYDFDPHSNVVEVCVRRLRQRLGPDAPIETVRNAGYRIALGLAERDALAAKRDAPRQAALRKAAG